MLRLGKCPPSLSWPLLLGRPRRQHLPTPHRALQRDDSFASSCGEDVGNEPHQAHPFSQPLRSPHFSKHALVLPWLVIDSRDCFRRPSSVLLFRVGYKLRLVLRRKRLCVRLYCASRKIPHLRCIEANSSCRSHVFLASFPGLQVFEPRPQHDSFAGVVFRGSHRRFRYPMAVYPGRCLTSEQG